MKKKGGSENTKDKGDYAGVVEDYPCDVLTAESGRGRHSDTWLLDSGCTYHMCPRREWFSTYQTSTEDRFGWETIQYVRLLALVMFA